MAGGLLNTRFARARQCPQSSGKVEVADIVDLSHEGHGVAHRQDKAVFIEDALPGEKVEWAQRRRGRNFDTGKLERIIEASPDRVTPRCAHFGVCGGCALQHLDPARQIEFKERQLLQALQRIGRVEAAEVLPPLHADAWSYRRRARLAARWVPKKNRTVVGFRERSTPYIADLQRCEVLRPQVAELLQPLSVLASALSVRARLPQIEVAVADNAVALVFRILEPLTDADADLLRTFGREHDVLIYLQPGGYETVAPLDTGALALTYHLARFDIELEFQPTDFVQVNGELNALMVERAVALLELTSADQVLDLFCGLGNFSLPLARYAGHVVGVEGDAALVQRAASNAVRNGLHNVEFFAANLAAQDLGQAPSTTGWGRRRYTRVLLDPPRAGAAEVLPVVQASGADRIVYVSCHPGTLARDAGTLVHEHGFRLQAAGVMDMFPHTTHVESIALFVK